MRRVLEGIADLEEAGAVAPSKLDLAKMLAEEGGSWQGAYAAIVRCQQIGLVIVDAAHPEASPFGRGAVRLSESGRRSLRK
jgi:hypothetical protein